LSAAVRFHVSSFCNLGNCVEVAALPGGQIALRDSKQPANPFIFSGEEWDAFLQGVRAGEFDRANLSR
jgi:hypothetical protein